MTTCDFTTNAEDIAMSVAEAKICGIVEELKDIIVRLDKRLREAQRLLEEHNVPGWENI
jgi:hypothetical protein